MLLYNTNIYVELNHFAVHLKHYKSTILQGEKSIVSSEPKQKCQGPIVNLSAGPIVNLSALGKSL